MHGTTRGLRLRSLALATGLVVAACQNTPTLAPSAGVTSTASPPASTAPSPSAAAVDVAPLFVEAMKHLDSGIVELDGSATVGPIKVDVSGTTTFDGPDNKGTVTSTVAGVSTVTETVLVAGKAYSKTGDGPWLAVPTPSSNGFQSKLTNVTASSLTDKGTTTRNGATVHQLEGSDVLNPGDLLSSATGISNVQGTTTFYCKDDGTPVGATIDMTWSQTAGAAALDASMTFEITFSSIGSAQTISAPAEVWKRFNVDKRGYSLAYPPNYDHTARQGFDYFVGPDDTFFFGSRIATQGYTLNIIAKSEVSSAKSSLKAKSVSNEDVVMGGIPGRLLKTSGTSADLGGKVAFFEAIVVKGKYAYFVAWVSHAGDEAADLATFMQVVSTFQFLA
jgi:hypothetical protein